jgi:hypothetical protein
MSEINIGPDFSYDPSGRFLKPDGDASGEAFREKILRPKLLALKRGEKLTIILDDGVESYGSSFLSEGIAGMIKYGYMTNDDLSNKIDIKYTNPEFEFFEKKIKQYIKEAIYQQKKYIPTNL